MPPERFALKKLNKKGLKTQLFLELQQAQLIPNDSTISKEGEINLSEWGEVQVTAETAEINKAIKILAQAL